MKAYGVSQLCNTVAIVVLDLLRNLIFHLDDKFRLYFGNMQYIVMFFYK